MTISAVRSLPTVVVSLLAALALVVAAVLLTGLGIGSSDSAGASWNKTATSAGASGNAVNTGVATKAGASWN